MRLESECTPDTIEREREATKQVHTSDVTMEIVAPTAAVPIKHEDNYEDKSTHLPKIDASSMTFTDGASIE